MADDEAEVTDIRGNEEQEETKELVETKEVVGTPVPVDQDSEEMDERREEAEETEKISDDVTEEQNKVNEEIEISKSPAPAESNNEAVMNGISDHSSNTDDVIENDHKRLEGMF